MSDIRAAALEAKDEAVSSLKQAIDDAEDLLQASLEAGDDRMADVRARLRDSVRAARERLTDAEIAVRAKSREVARATDVYVHENPYRSMGAAAALGLLIGVLLTRR